MKKVNLFTIILAILILSGILYLLFQPKTPTGAIIKNNHTHIHTKTICNETNYCQDYKITCKGNEAIEMLPITGATIQQPSNWQDLRNQTEKNNLCE